MGMQQGDEALQGELREVRDDVIGPREEDRLVGSGGAHWDAPEGQCSGVPGSNKGQC
jgi:hypothetical protein